VLFDVETIVRTGGVVAVGFVIVVPLVEVDGE
jgi:hypothetical protein